ncbi:MAG TPA: hypothetical protein VMA77_14435 [Solirubrobacteraceae bacterium]|nr:hypothetical protein [Solirubrobacteraceae bacterium]
MSPIPALGAGLIAGLAVAMQVGAVSLLLIEAAVVSGRRAGVAAGMGVATVDFGFAAVAAAASGVAGAALARYAPEIRVAGALVSAVVAVYGLATFSREGGPPAAPAVTGAPRLLYARFVAITAVNPLTIASFAAVAAALSLGGPGAAAAFAVGAGAASAGWHLMLTLAAGQAGRWISPRVRRGLAIGGRLLVLAIAAHLALR